MMGYGNLTAKGFNASTGLSYDINSGTLPKSIRPARLQWRLLRACR